MRFVRSASLAFAWCVLAFAAQAQAPNPLARKQPTWTVQLPAPTTPVASAIATEEWRGAMTCWKDRRSIDLHVSVSRTDLGRESGIVTLRDSAFGIGVYEVRGQYANSVSLMPVRWIEQLPTYFAMTLNGSFDRTRQKITGSTPWRECPTFELTKTSETRRGLDLSPEVRATEALVGADRGEPIEMRRYGLFQYYGLGVPRDVPSAAVWLKKAALAGDYEASFLYGVMLENGEAGGVNLNEAYNFLYAAGKQEISLECCVRGGSKRLVGDFSGMNNPAQNAANRVWQKLQAPSSQKSQVEVPKLPEPRPPRCSTTTRCETMGVGQQICRDVVICE